MENFKEYLSLFESHVLASKALFGVKEELVPVRPGRLSRAPVGALLGSTFVLPEPLVVDYYGHLKKSSGFLVKVERAKKKYVGKQVRMVLAPVVHFATVKIEVVAKLAPELVADFPAFKKRILNTRGFKHDF